MKYVDHLTSENLHGTGLGSILHKLDPGLSFNRYEHVFDGVVWPKAKM